MWLPDARQVAFFSSNYTQVEEKLISALASENADVRQRAAHVIGEIGPNARSCGPALLARLKVEPERLVRIYITNALAAIGYRSMDGVKELQRRFESLSDENAPRTMLDIEYADVDERINVAAALYVLAEEADRETYLSFVQQWLDPPPADLTPELLRGYWERRWTAVICLEHMRGATSAIPLLESMLAEENAESWVTIHVPRVLDKLRKHASR